MGRMPYLSGVAVPLTVPALRCGDDRSDPLDNTLSCSPNLSRRRRRRSSRWIARLLAVAMAPLAVDGCTTMRVTDPNATADEIYLKTIATQKAVAQISVTALRDRKVYVDYSYLSASTQPSDDQAYLLAELRNKMLQGGVRVVPRDKAEIIMEVRSQGISNNHLEFLLGVPASSVGGIFTGGIAAQTPELTIIKQVTQQGYSSVAYVAYWQDTGEVVAASGPFIGRTRRQDYWFFGYGPRTLGNIPPTEPAPVEGGTVDANKEKAATQPAK